MNNLIRLSFQNDKTLSKEHIISEREFPIKTVFSDKKRTYAVIDLSDDEVFDKYIENLSQYIIKKYENKILKRIIKKNYPEIPAFAIGEIIKLKDEENFSERVSFVKKILKRYFRENSTGNVEGLVSFRFFEYKKMLNRLADELVDIYYLNREYEDFIELLRYFVAVQDNRPKVAYICAKKDGSYQILNENKEDITQKCVMEFANAEETKSISFDDLLISILITLAPEKIIVKNSENIKNTQLFETIEKVFEEIEYKK